MSAFEVLLLNTSIPQIQAAQAGDTYVVPRDIAINATAIISANSATDALRITQTGAGNALVVEDSANPDATPFVVSAAGDVGIGTSSPGTKLDVVGVITSRSDTFAAVRFKSAAGTDKAFLSYEDSATSVILNNYGSGSIIFKTVDAERMRLDASGNLGLGVRPSASWGSSYKVAQIGATQSLALSWEGDVSNISTNAVKNASAVWVLQNTSSYKPTLYDQYLGQHRWHYGVAGSAGDNASFTQAMTLDASGNLGVGTTSPGSYGKFAISSTGTPTTAYASILSGSGTYNAAFESTLYLGAARTDIVDNNVVAGWRFKTYSPNAATGAYLAFESANSAVGAFAPPSTYTERARITSGGDLLVGKTGAAGARVDIVAASGGAALQARNDTAAVTTVGVWNDATSGDNTFVTFYTEATATTRGSITYNRAGGLTAYNTTSDYRAKDIIGPVTDAGVTIDALKVYNGKMKGATVERPMLIAHEAQAVTPYAVTGEKDAVDEDGKPKYQQMDVSSLVPLLIAEIQSLRARVAQLEAK